MTEFGKALRIIRINSEDSAKQMAEKLEISVPYLNAIENGRRDVPNDLLEKIVSAYPLSARDQANLKEALVTTKDRVKINLTELGEKKRRVIMALAQDDIDSEIVEQICNLVNKGKEETYTGNICTTEK